MKKLQRNHLRNYIRNLEVRPETLFHVIFLAQISLT